MIWFDNMKLSRKLLIGFGAITALTLTTGTVGIIGMGTIDAADTHLYEDYTVPLGEVGVWNMGVEQYQLLLRDLVLSDVEAEHLRILDQLEKLMQRSDSLAQKYEGSISEEEDRRLYQAVLAARDAFRPVARRAVDLARNNADDDALLALVQGEVSRVGAAYGKALDELAALNVRLAEQTALANTALYKRTRLVLLGVMLFSAVLGMGLAIYIARLISTRLNALLQRAEELKDRDITNLGRGSEAMARGELGYHVDYGTKPLAFAFRDEVGELAGTIDAIITHTADTVGRFSRAQEMVRNVIAETGTLVQAASEGKLEKRADASRFPGGYGQLVGGLNATLDAVMQPIQESARVLEKVAQRDLTARMAGDYRGDYAKIKDALNTAVENLEAALTEVSAAAEQVGAGSTQITAGSQSLASGASEQASSLEEVSSSLQQLASMTRQNAANAQEARSLTQGAEGAVQSGVGNVGRLADAMARIKGASDSTAKIVKTIDEIAFQTNLLALNAAVEAARAGDAGKGFAVVAEEVRSLAIRSAEAAKNTASLIEEAVHSAEEGVGLNAEALKSLELIQERVTRVGAVMGEIAAASEQQSEGVGQINGAVEQMNGVTQQVAASSEESASTAEELSAQAAQLRALVNGFVLSIDARSSVTRPAPARVAAPAPAPRAPAAPKKAADRPRRAGNGSARSGVNTNGHSRTSGATLIPFADDDVVLSEF